LIDVFFFFLIRPPPLHPSIHPTNHQTIFNKLCQADYEGKVCGSTENKGKYRAIYPRLTEDMFEMAQQTAAGESKVSPESINFYGVCVESCPKTGEFICDRKGEEKLAELEEQKELKGTEKFKSRYPDVRDAHLEYCVDKTMAKGGAFLSKDPGLYTNPTCQTLLEHCWKVDSDTKSIFYRCLPLHNITKYEKSGCLYPSSEIDVTDDRCSKQRIISTTISEQPAKKNYLYEQLNGVFATVMRYFGDVQKA
jgi:hypothetical protein